MAHVSALDARERAQIAGGIESGAALGVNVPLPIIGRADEVIE